MTMEAEGRPDPRVTFRGYQEATHETAIYPGAEATYTKDGPDDAAFSLALTYAVLGLAGESGEIANEVKKIMRDDDGHLDSFRHAKLVAELGDVLWYVARIAWHLGYSLDEIAAMNLSKLQGRKARGMIKGGGDER